MLLYRLNTEIKVVIQNANNLKVVSKSSPKNKHICNSHKLTHYPKIAKELVCLPPLFCRLEKQNLDITKIENIMTEDKAQQVTMYIKNRRGSSKIKVCSSFQPSSYLENEVL